MLPCNIHVLYMPHIFNPKNINCACPTKRIYFISDILHKNSYFICSVINLSTYVCKNIAQSDIHIGFQCNSL